LTPLNLPSYDHRLKEAEGKLWIFDPLRKKFLVLTPEEWVRQHFVNYLTVHLKYPRSLIKIEGGLTYNQLAKRSDIVVFDRDGKPWMLVECKSPDIKLSEQTIRQAAMYNSKLSARFITVSNGLAHMTCKVDPGGIDILSSLPAFED
jgi:hypothetical protein